MRPAKDVRWLPRFPGAPRFLKAVPRQWTRLGMACLAFCLVGVTAALFGVAGEGGAGSLNVRAARANDDSCARPYSGSSPWNAPIPRGVVYDARSDAFVRSIGPTFTSDPTQYTYPLYDVTKETPRQRVDVAGWYSNVTAAGARLVNQRRGAIRMPIPEGASAATGTDAQIILHDPETGDEWGAWQLRQTGAATWGVTNAYHYNTRWVGVPPKGFVSRGAGLPYFAGLVRPCEIARGTINHALAFAYDYPTPSFVYPATKSDGTSSDPSDMPEGTRLQLDPTITQPQIATWGCVGPCLTIALALQRYGMYVIDQSGRPKVYLEYDGTAEWNGLVSSKTVSTIPVSAFKVVDPACRVPSVVNSSATAAAVALARWNCRAGAIKRVKSAAAAGRVVKQVPTAGRVLAPGARIMLTVSRARKS